VSGSDTWTTTVAEVEKEKKNFYGMYSFYKNWNLLFML
jgi:hypothetical protein